MKNSWKGFLCGAAALLGMANANAVYTITVSQVGGNVVMSGTGQINTTGLTVGATNTACAGQVTGVWFGGTGILCIGSGQAGLLANGGGGFTVPVMGTGGQTTASSATGSPVFMTTNSLYLPAGYTSNTPISSSSTFSGKTLATLGATVGTYTVTLPSDTIVINVVAPAPVSVPTLSPISMAVFALLLLAGGYVALQRRPG